jgi:hypothetical protein
MMLMEVTWDMTGRLHSLRRGDAETGRRGDFLAPDRRVPVSPHPASRGNQYTVFSLWDTFRAAHPLYTIIDQKRTADFINTFIRIYEQGGRLPVWELWGEETDTMIGYHAVPVIADAMAKGIKGFDYEKAYAAAKHSAELESLRARRVQTTRLRLERGRQRIGLEDTRVCIRRLVHHDYGGDAIQSSIFEWRKEVPGR